MQKTPEVFSAQPSSPTRTPPASTTRTRTSVGGSQARSSHVRDTLRKIAESEARRDERHRSHRRRRKRLTETETQELREAFELFDVDRAGFIDAKKLKAGMAAMGVDRSNDEIRSMIFDVDKDGSGRIDFHAFVDMMTSSQRHRDQREEMIKGFRLFADSESQTISVKNLRRIALEVGEAKLPEEDLLAMIRCGDHDRDGVVGLEDFCRLMKKTTLYEERAGAPT
eukprot:gnl/Trimastix_PCT/2421.p2 GENE.gnl/Trimastix_PCT/2421~~gnl/Trimastix_PCT/2421.p2  ORF type:complete len:225 (-),score=39.46 gnl/Trimastix_PCT/2421:341-1015(-)